MIKFLTKRFAQSLFIVWGVLTLTFVVVQLAPGDPASIYIRPDIDPATVALIRKEMGLDLPLWQQYTHWMGEFITGNFGVSFVSHRPVKMILSEAIPNTLRLTIIVLFFQFVVGILLGIFMAVAKKNRAATTINAILLTIYSLPGFWLALMLIMIFSLKLGWLPSSQMASMTTPQGFWAQLWDAARHLVLPVVVLGSSLIAYTARFVRGNLSETLKQDYIRMARAFGLPKRKILYKYSLKNALLPLATMLGLYFPFLIGGAVVIEYVFAWPGMGRITINAIFSHDYPLILASCFVAAMAVVIGNLVSDLLYLVVDPRIKMTKNIT